MPFTLLGIKQESMILAAFQEKLAKLNPDLYVDVSASRKMENGLRHCGIYLRAKNRVISDAVRAGNANAAHAKHEAYLNALAEGSLDHFMGGVCIDHIPEFDVFNEQWTRLAVPGWRSIVMRLVVQKATTLDKARKVFAHSLGETAYDRMNFFQKIQFIKEREKQL